MSKKTKELHDQKYSNMEQISEDWINTLEHFDDVQKDWLKNAFQIGWMACNAELIKKGKDENKKLKDALEGAAQTLQVYLREFDPNQVDGEAWDELKEIKQLLKK